MPLTSAVAVTFVGWFAGARGEEPLHAAARTGNVVHAHLALMRHPGAVNRPCRIGKGDYPSPVHLAAYRSNTGVLKLLIARGGDVNDKGRSGWSPLQHATMSKSRDCAELLLAHRAKLDIFSAVGLDKWDEVRRCFAAARALGLHEQLANASLPLWFGRWRLLNWTIGGGHLRMVELLLANGARVNPQRAPYSWPERPPLHEAMSQKRSDIATILLKHGADLNAQDYDGYTALHRAILYGDGDGARFLLKHGASVATRIDFHAVRISDLNGDQRTFFTPLHTAAKYGNAELVALLLAHGANPNARAAVPFPQGVITSEWERENATPQARAARSHTPLDVAAEIPDEWNRNDFAYQRGTLTPGRVLCVLLLRQAGGYSGTPNPDRDARVLNSSAP